MVQESHDPQRSAWLDTHFFAWSRFICRDGPAALRDLRLRGLRWLQLHVRNAVASREDPRRSASAAALSLALRAEQCRSGGGRRSRGSSTPACNTLSLSVQDHVVDGMGRERPAVSRETPDTRTPPVRYAFGETRASRRFLRTLSEGITNEGYFMDSWPSDRPDAPDCPAPDRRGPLRTDDRRRASDSCSTAGATSSTRATWTGSASRIPRLLRFSDTLERWRRPDGLLPVEDFGTPSVWMDRNDCYPRQKYKQCAYNLYAAAMFRHALAPLARAFGEDERALRFERISRELLDAAVRVFWSEELGIFVNNLPWIAEEKTPRLCDRSLATRDSLRPVPRGEDVRRAPGARRASAGTGNLLSGQHPVEDTGPWSAWGARTIVRPGITASAGPPSFGPAEQHRAGNLGRPFRHARTNGATAGGSPSACSSRICSGSGRSTRAFPATSCVLNSETLGRLQATAYTPARAFEFEVEPLEFGHRLAVTAPATGSGRVLLPTGAAEMKPGRNVFLIPRSR
jgi:hypothetical protein